MDDGRRGRDAEGAEVLDRERARDVGLVRLGRRRRERGDVAEAQRADVDERGRREALADARDDVDVEARVLADDAQLESEIRDAAANEFFVG